MTIEKIRALSLQYAAGEDVGPPKEAKPPKMDKRHTKLTSLKKQPAEELIEWRDSLVKRQAKRGRRSRRTGLIRRVEAALASQAAKQSGIAVCGSACSTAEVEFITKAREKGWNITNRGWPDFLLWNDNEIICVEVKDYKDDLSDHQKLVNRLLAKAGIKCYKWRPDSGFERLHADGS